MYDNNFNDNNNNNGEPIEELKPTTSINSENFSEPHSAVNSAEIDTSSGSRRFMRLSLSFSLLGLLLSIIGLGLSFSILGLIFSAIKKKSTNSQTVSWTLYIGILGTIMNVVMLIVIGQFDLSTLLYVLEY